MRYLKILLLFSLVILIVSCKKDTKTGSATSSTTTDNYSSVKDFFSKNSVAMQTYTVDGAMGGYFTTPQGTTITIPANAFVTQASVPVTGIVTIKFKDIYKKSDMLLSNMPTMTYSNSPLKSGGEFFIKAIQNNSALNLATGSKITVNQPTLLTGGLDTLNRQQPFVQVQDSSGNSRGWGQTSADSVSYAAGSYVFSLYQFRVPSDSGTWSNSDNSSFFSAYPQTTLTLVPLDSISNYSTEVFLVFKNISSMVHVYNYGGFNFPYYYAPQGLLCTLVAVGVKSGKLYSSFVPITISANQSVNFSLSATTTSDFITQLKALD